VLRARDAAAPTEANEAVQDGIVFLYMSDGEMRVLFELLTDVDEGVQEWRYRHVKMVERTIGNKPGTGGSSGVAYLKTTLFTPAFPDLWAMRHRL
jgi:tryptophan 2,3-dioxygenase